MKVCFHLFRAEGSGEGSKGIANPVVSTLSPQRWLDRGNNNLGFLVEDRWQNVLAKEFFEKTEK